MPDPNTLKSRGRPKQARGERTAEAILEATAALLDEVGIERLSTNMVCKRAGLAPPSLYRFFPNKYALVKELADRLMTAQNSALANRQIDLENLTDSIFKTLKSQLEVTLAFKGGPMIMRSLHAVPVLRAVRLKSHETATRALFQRYADLMPDVPEDELRRRARLVIEVGYATLEYAFDAPKAARVQILKDAAHMLSLYHQDMVDRKTEEKTG